MPASDVASQWNAITSLATLGTNRGVPPAEKLWPAQEIAAPPGPPERTLLRTAALSYLWHLAGARVAATEPPPPDIAPSTEARVVAESAMWRLARMLGGDHRDLVPEWLSLVAQAGSVLPRHWLPVVLNGLQAKERAIASPVLGPGAEWLCAKNPEWTGAAPTSGLPIDRWNNGTLPERRAALVTMREADPTGGRILLERTWPTEPPDARAAFLQTLLDAPGLSEGDEPFLEAALNDKRKDVRMAAVECLCRLPASAHAKRNLERLQPLVTLTEVGSGLLGKLRKRRLEITLPESLDKAAARDGINAKPPAQQKIGERAYWLMQMIGMAPPAHWCTRFQCDIDTFINAALATDYATDLLLALTDGAIRHRDTTWVVALCERWAGWLDHAELRVLAVQSIGALIVAVPASEQDALIRRLLAASKASQLELLQSMLATVEVAWSAETTRIAFELLDQSTNLGGPDYTRPRNTLAHWGPRVEVATARRALERMLTRLGDKSPWRNAVEALNDIVEFRLAMKQELTT